MLSDCVFVQFDKAAVVDPGGGAPTLPSCIPPSSFLPMALISWIRPWAVSMSTYVFHTCGGSQPVHIDGSCMVNIASHHPHSMHICKQENEDPSNMDSL